MNDFYAVVAPRWHRPFRYQNETALGRRYLFRWQVVREIRPRVMDGILVTAYEHHSLHWRRRNALRAARKAMRAAQVGGGE